MKLETFFKNFDLFADVPGAVGKLRELVLQLAVRGKIVSQNPQDEPAARAIAQIVAANGTGSGGKPFVSARLVEMPFTVPATWEWVRFGDLVRIRTGKLDANAAVEDGTYPFFTCSKTPSKIATFSFDTSAVILAGNGDFNLKVYSGRFDAYQRTYVIEPLGWELGFCFWLVSAQIKRITGNQRGSAVPYLRLGDIANPLVPFPPLAEQKRIVAKVDELMALCDRLEAQQQEREARHAALARASLARFADAPTPANLDFLFHNSYAIAPADLRKAILTLAVQGKLVPQDVDDEPAGKIQAGITADIAKAVRGKRMKNPRPIPPYDGELPFELPLSWTWAPLGTLTAPEDGAMCDGPFGSKLKTEHYIATKGYAVLRLGNIGVGYFINGKEGYISRAHYESLSNNHTKPGDLLVAGLADPLARCCEIPPDIGPAVNKSDCFRVRLSHRMDRSYVRHYLNSPIAKAFAAEENHGMTRERINLANAKALPVPVPPLAEQRRIVAKVEQLMALVDALEAQLAASRRIGAELLDAILAELTAEPIP